MKKKNESTFISNKITFPEAINERINTSILSGELECFLPLETKLIKKGAILSCSIENLMPLDQYLSGIIAKEQFLDLVIQLLDMIQRCEKIRIDSSNIDCKADRIFIDPRSHDVKCIYWPLVNNKAVNHYSVFFKELPHSIKLNDKENLDYIYLYNDFFESYKEFSIYSFNRLVNNLAGRPVEDEKNRIPFKTSSGSSKLSEKDRRVSMNMVEYSLYDTEVLIPDKHESYELDDEVMLCPFCGEIIFSDSIYCSECGKKIKGTG